MVPPAESPLEPEEAAPVFVGETVPVDELIVDVAVVDPVSEVGEAVDVEVIKTVVGPGCVSEAVVEVEELVVEELEELVDVEVELVDVDELVLDEDVEELVVLEELDVELEEVEEVEEVDEVLVGGADVVEVDVGTAEVEAADILSNECSSECSYRKKKTEVGDSSKREKNVVTRLA